MPEFKLSENKNSTILNPCYLTLLGRGSTMACNLAGGENLSTLDEKIEDMLNYNPGPNTAVD